MLNTQIVRADRECHIRILNALEQCATHTHGSHIRTEASQSLHVGVSDLIDGRK